jgi:hypothetical protein
MARFRAAVAAHLARGGGDGATEEAVTVARTAAGIRSVILVEGVSDRAAVETLAERTGRHLDETGVCIVALGGATNIARYLTALGPDGLGVGLAGLCDEHEEGYFRRALERIGVDHVTNRFELEAHGFFVCVADLEDELIRALTPATVVEILRDDGMLEVFRTFQNQPAQRARPLERQLRRFMGTTSGRKEHCARRLVRALEAQSVPRPLTGVLAAV